MLSDEMTCTWVLSHAKQSSAQQPQKSIPALQLDPHVIEAELKHDVGDLPPVDRHGEYEDGTQSLAERLEEQPDCLA